MSIGRSGLLRRQGGFSLVEIIIATALVGVAVTAMLGVMAVAVRGTDAVSQRSTALQIARSQVESIKNQPYAEPIAYATITPPNNDFQISIGGTVLTPGYLEEITVTVAYPEGNNPSATTQLSAYKVNHFPPILAAKPLPPPAPACPQGATCYTYYLHNNPTPPTGDTNAQVNLPMDTTSRIAYDEYNYDQNRNNDPGLSISKGGSGVGETDLTKYQNWRITTPFASPFHIKGQVEVHIWSAMKNFNQHKRGEVLVFLRHYTGTSYTEIANASLTETDWQGGFSDFVSAEVKIPNVDYTIPSGHFLEVKLLVGNQANDDMWFMYDNVDFDSRVYIPTVTP